MKGVAGNPSRALLISAALPAWGAGIAAAELLLLLLGPLAGAIAHAVLVAGLSNFYLIMRRRLPGDDPGERASLQLCLRVVAVLSLVPLLRLLALSVPVSTVSPPYQYTLVGAPMTLAALLALRMVGGPRWLPSDPGRLRPQLVLAASGLPLGLVAFLILRPAPLVTSWSPPQLVVATLILFAFTGLLEELIFRGLLQRVWAQASGDAGVLWSTAIFAFTYFGTRSPGFVLFITLVGLLFAVSYKRSGSLLGVAAAHGCFSAGLLLFWPLIVGHGS
jgi:uncharacterized protein